MNIKFLISTLLLLSPLHGMEIAQLTKQAAEDTALILICSVRQTDEGKLMAIFDGMESEINLGEGATLPSAAQKIIEEGANVNQQFGDLHCTPLLLAIERGQTEVAKVLVRNGADIDYKDRRGYCPLLAALEKKDVQTTKLLINEGAEVNTEYKKGITPLHLATRQGEREIVALLLSKGAHGKPTTIFLFRPLNYRRPLHIAAEKGHTEIAKLLLDHGADITAKIGFTYTAFQLAADNGHLDTCRDMLSHYLHLPPCTNQRNSAAIMVSALWTLQQYKLPKDICYKILTCEQELFEHVLNLSIPKLKKGGKVSPKLIECVAEELRRYTISQLRTLVRETQESVKEQGTEIALEEILTDENFSNDLYNNILLRFQSGDIPKYESNPNDSLLSVSKFRLYVTLILISLLFKAIKYQVKAYFAEGV